MKRIQTRAAYVAAMALALIVGMVGTALATTPVDEANTAVSNGVTDATSIVTTNIPLVLGVTVAFVALRFGKKLLGKIG